jgi:2-amino-4-hydroxy-6-hydroxymethyldihydropteridine diphosphokinase
VTRYAIGLGSNLGDRLQNLIAASAELSRRLGRLEVSALYETEPVGGPDQDPFLNAAVLVHTELEPMALLDVCQEIELMRDRERKIRWGPRTLDLDIIASDGPPLATERLTIPHPRAVGREFVLRPVVDVWPEAPVGKGLTAAGAVDVVPDQGVDRLTNEWLPPVSRWKSRAFLAIQFGLFLAVAVALAYDGTLPDGEVGITRVLGAAAAFVGVILAFVASRRLGPALAAPPIPRPDADLVTSGPYRFARHPIYGGITMFMMGTALVVDSFVGLAVSALLLPFFLVKARYEEKQLRMRYPGYLAYRQTVPRWLIPYVV